SPGERAEIVVRVEPGDDVILRSYPYSAGMDFFNRRLNGGEDTFDILKIRAAAQLEASAPLPAQLATLDLPDESESVATRRFKLSNNSEINGKQMDMGRIDLAVTVDTAEI